MKQIFKYIGVFSLMLFSFYYTNYIASFMCSKTELMKEIKGNIEVKRVNYVNAVINNNYIIPGLNGIEINVSDSYSNMLNVGQFDENYLIYNEIMPTISLNNNIKKIIKKANPLKRSIALIISDKELIDYCIKNNIKANYLITNSTIINSNNIEYLNNEVDHFYEIERFLNKNNKNKDICIVNDFNNEICQSNGKYLVEPTYIINNSNLSSLISEVDNGDILKPENLSLTNFIILINKIKYRALRIDFLSDLISEKYSTL